jgi:regulator of sigma E protease
MGTNIFAFIIVLGVLIFFHEFGHFLIARLFGVGVEKFSLGFGPRLIGKKIGITDYRLSAIPLGGYVKMVGEEPDAAVDPADISISFTHKHVAKRMLIVAAGPVFNILLAILIFFGIFWTSGKFIMKPSIGSVKAGSPAASAGLRDGDLITMINGTAIVSWDQMADIINGSEGKTLSLSIKRQDSILDFSIAPQKVPTQNIFGEDIQRYVIGITASGDSYSKDLGFMESVGESMVQSYKVIELMVVIIGKLIKGDISTDTLGGPIMIAQMAGDSAKAGVGSLIFFIALISINLAVINLLPIPVLDGGHLLFFLIEAIKGSPVSIKIREVAQQVGLFILILLMILVFYNDITRIFFS